MLEVKHIGNVSIVLKQLKIQLKSKAPVLNKVLARKVNKLTKTLSDMTVTEAASKALELIAYGDWDNQKGYSWRTAREGTFEEYVISEYFDGETEVYDSVTEDYIPVTELQSFDTDSIWQSLHGEGGSGTRDGWTGKVVSSYGGEGEGDQYWMVVSVSDGETTRYFRKDGWYASYDGGYLDGETYEVAPKEKLVTYYE